MSEKAMENSETSENSTICTKHHYRNLIWSNLEKNSLVNFPRPCNNRIPNFKGSEQASSLLATLPEFNQSENINVSPDKPQEPVRYNVLAHGKCLYVPTPRLANGLMSKIEMEEGAGQDEWKRAVNRRGLQQCGKGVGVEENVKIDLIVLGSVAVSKEGYRIGKGKGYADLEFAILSQMKAVNQDTVVITTVHDTQVFDSLSPEMFKPHDVPVDIIVTPTQVIHVENRLPKPNGIIWNLLTQKRLDHMPVLKTLRDMDEKAGKDVTLKEDNSDNENQDPKKKRYRKFYRNNRRRPINKEAETEQQVDQTSENVENKRPPQRRKYNRRSKAPRVLENGQNDQNINQENQQIKSSNRRRKSKIDFSLMVRNIERSMRIRDMKEALAERGVKPRLITWRRYKGYCCLHFSKSPAASEADHNVDKVISMLNNLNVNPQPNKQISIEVMRPISRIETTDVTAV